MRTLTARAKWLRSQPSRHGVASSGSVLAKNPLVCLTLRFEQLKPEHGGFDEGAHARGETEATLLFVTEL